MARKNKNTVFIFQIVENYLKLASCSVGHSGMEIHEIELLEFPGQAEEKKIQQELKSAFQRMQYRNEPVFVCLPRLLATCRYIKVPSRIPQEIEKIASYQASRYLPYPANELVTGFEVISSDKDGYSHVNLIVVQRNTVVRYLDLLCGYKPAKININLSSYGLAGLYNYLRPREPSPVTLVDIDAAQAEIAIVSQGKAILSRSIKFNRQGDLTGYLFEELRRTREAYLKETAGTIGEKVFIFGQKKTAQAFGDFLKVQQGFSVETMVFDRKIKFSDKAQELVMNSQFSFSALIGTPLEKLPESLNLIPREAKRNASQAVYFKSRFKITLLLAGLIAVWGVAILKNLDNKTKYLEQLKVQLSRVSKEARPLEKKERMLKAMALRPQDKFNTLDVLNGVYRSIPADVVLTYLVYDESQQLSLRGNAGQLNDVFKFVQQLEGATVLKGFSVKVRYATKRATSSGETVDFEISCAKR
ncbi:MAG: PilN domain-containing protein [Candidatus Omnitrophica bacterium]|nr:PilN domain-containing protein [Candidatus Omnitrophota bacterium]MDD5513274.1 PilN domain-containing protein [Candidatus Omnitrophota bacterium]